jgi:hypothetical protein
MKTCFLKKQYSLSGFNEKTVDFLVEHKRLMKIGVISNKEENFKKKRKGEVITNVFLE